MSKKNYIFKKRKGGIHTIIITLVLILIVLVSIPIFKSFSNTNANFSKSSTNNFTNFINESGNIMDQRLTDPTTIPYSN